MKTILVVEDEGIIARDLQLTLVRLGYAVPRTAQTGDEALRDAEALRPDLALMDIKLKGSLDGIETAAQLRARWDIPVVYLTSHADEVTLNRAKATGPYGYLLKPFKERDLRTAIEVALHKHAMESMLAERVRWFSSTLRSVGDAVIATDPQENITFMNGVAETLTGWRDVDAIGKKLSEVFHLVDAAGGRIASPQVRGLRDVFHAQGDALGAVVVFREVTDQKKEEARLARSERLASLGTMAARLSQEINAPLLVVAGNVGVAAEAVSRARAALVGVAGAEEALRELVAASECLGDSSVATNRVDQIVRDLRKLSREDDVEKHVLDLPDVLDAAVKMAGASIPHGGVLRRTYGTTPFVEGNEGRLVQVFTNLLVNAWQSLGARSASQEIEIATRTDDGGRAVVEVRDTGVGIARQDIARIFEPFYSSRPPGVRMGMGLAVCHSLVAALGGEITVESEVGRGSVFRVAIPPAPRRDAVSVAPTARPDGPARGRVMILDDEPALARLVARVLRDHHDVVTETDGRVALGRIAAGEEFDVILCDLMMPAMSGIDFYEALSAPRPDLAKRVIFMTGGVYTKAAETFLRATENLVLTKPFSSEALRALVRERVG